MGKLCHLRLHRRPEPAKEQEGVSQGELAVLAGNQNPAPDPSSSERTDSSVTVPRAKATRSAQ